MSLHDPVTPTELGMDMVYGDANAVCECRGYKMMVNSAAATIILSIPIENDVKVRWALACCPDALMLLPCASAAPGQAWVLHIAQVLGPEPDMLRSLTRAHSPHHSPQLRVPSTLCCMHCLHESPCAMRLPT